MSAGADAEALRAAWFRAQGAAGPVIGTVHPSDDMARPDVQRVEPGFELAHYARSGYEGFAVLQHALRTAGRELSELSSLLDFAGGYGRILRLFAAELAPDKVWASDVLEPAVAFAQETFGVQAFRSATAPEDLELPRRFEVIWVASLFSHLPRETFVGFLSMLYNALEPNGLLVFSTHTPEVLAEADRAAGGFTFQLSSESHVLDFGDYGSTFVEPQLVRELCREAGVAHVYGLERELWRIQDLYIASPSAQPGLEAWRPASVAHGTITKADVSEAGHAWVGGHVRVPAHEAPIRGVTLILGEYIEANRKPASIRALDGELPLSEGGARYRQFDWYLEGPTPELLDASKPLAAVAQLASGAEWCFDVTWLGRGARG